MSVVADTPLANESDDLARSAPVRTPPPPVDLQKVELHPPGASILTADAARELIAQTKSARDQFTALIHRHYEGSAHLVLGYSNFGQFCKEQLQLDSRAAYRHVEVGQIRQVLSDNFVTDVLETSDSAVAKLAPLKDDPSQMAAALEEATGDARERGREAPTASDVGRAVRKRRDLARQQSAAATERDGEPLNSAQMLEKPEPLQAPSNRQLTVRDAVAAVVRAIEESEPDVARDAAHTALQVLARRLRETPPETLVTCIESLLECIARGQI